MYLDAVSWKFRDVVSYCGDPQGLPHTDLGSISVGSSSYIFSEPKFIFRGNAFMFTVSILLSNKFLRRVSKHAHSHREVIFPNSQFIPLFTVFHTLRTFKFLLRRQSLLLVFYHTVWSREQGVCLLPQNEVE